MGERTVFISEDLRNCEWPNWFKEKYSGLVTISQHTNQAGTTHVVLFTPFELKLYSKEMERFFDDVRDCLPEIKYSKVRFVCMHENGAAVRVTVMPHKVVPSIPLETIDLWAGNTQEQLEPLIMGLIEDDAAHTETEDDGC